MLKSYNKIKIPDLSKKHNLIFEVNYDPDDENSNECKVVRVTFPSGEQAFIDKEHLMAFLFAIGRAEEQRDLIPKKVQTIRKYHTMLGITATKNIKKGEKINVEVDIPLPPIEQEILEASKNNGTPLSNTGIWTPSK